MYVNQQYIQQVTKTMLFAIKGMVFILLNQYFI